jgi:hypothetical protein
MIISLKRLEREREVQRGCAGSRDKMEEKSLAQLIRVGGRVV